MKWIGDRQPSPASVVAVLALVTALGGTALAGAGGTSGALSKKKVKGIVARQIGKLAPGLADKQINDRAPGLSVARATSADSAGNAGTLEGEPASAFASSNHFHGELPSGKTLRGVYAVQDFAAGGGDFATESVNYPLALPSSPQIHSIAIGTPPPAACPGSVTAPQAAPGHLCVYEQSATNRDPGDVAFLNGGGRDRLGFGLTVLAAAGGPNLSYQSNGSWAVTAR